MIGPMGGRQGDVFPEGKKGGEPEEDDGTNPSRCHGQKENEDHHPPGIDAGVQVQYHFLPSLAFDRFFKNESGDRGNKQENENACHQNFHLRIERRQFHDLAIAPTAARARVKKASFDSSGRSRSGEPKLTEQRKGMGRNSPFGKTRLALSR